MSNLEKVREALDKISLFDRKDMEAMDAALSALSALEDEMTPKEPRDLDPQLAKDAAQRFRRYLAAFNGQRFDDADPVKQNLAMALDHLEEASAMLLNLADRAARSQPHD